VRRVVVTGLGIVSSIGADVAEVAESLRTARSGVVAAPEYAELGFRCQVHAPPKIGDWTALVDRRAARFLAAGTAYAHIAMEQAIADSGLSEAEISNDRTGIIVGSGGASTRAIVEAADIAKTRGVKRIGPFAVPKAMSSGPSATLATWFKIRGVNYSISSSCATSTHCIGAAYEQIQLGKQDVMFAGGCEELDWTLSALFDAMGAMTSNFNATPDRASRPYDKNRDGFVIAGGGGMVVLEDYERAKARGATIHGEIVGYAANSDGHDMVAPSGEGAARCMRLAMAGAGDRTMDYLNTHGTGTPVGDAREIGAVREVFGADMPTISSTKSLTGHSLGAAGVQEAIYCLLMMKDGFIGESANIETLDPEFDGVPIARTCLDRRIDTAMSNSFGFGGTNGCLVMSRV
jgi:3-oxoacyl-[acyl-carrier-protein] synthase-1